MSYSTSLRINLQVTGTNSNTWGDVLDTQALTPLEAGVSGWTTKALSGNYTLTANNGSADEARSAMLKFTGTGAFIVTVPAVSKRYDVWNACTGVLTLTNGSASVTVQPGEVVSVINDGNANFARVVPTDFASARITSVGAPIANSDAATKLYVDSTALGGMTGTFPGQTGNEGKTLTTDGVSTPRWADPPRMVRRNLFFDKRVA